MFNKLFILFKVVVIFHLLFCLINVNLTTTFICLFNLMLLFITDYVKRKLNYGNVLHFFIYLFLVASLVGGEVYYLYSKIWFFDIILHTLSSFIVSWLFLYFVGLYRGNINNILLMICIFSFAMMIACLWEIIEFSIDRVFDKDMQKDTIINEVNSILLSDDSKTIVKKEINSMTIGDYSIDGYLDIGLYDTIGDMICAVVGSILFIIVDRLKEASV